MSSFRRVAEEEVFRGWLFSVGKVDMLDPDGHAFERFVVHHPGAVTIIPVDHDGRVTLVRQFRTSVDRLMLEAPAGTCDVPDEPREVTARRELAEEAGLEAVSMEVLMDTFNTPGISDQFTTIYLATGLSACPVRPVGIEEGHMTVESIHLSEVDALIADGTLLDETTVLGLLLARARLAQATE